jgi:ribosomal protein L27
MSPKAEEGKRLGNKRLGNKKGIKAGKVIVRMCTGRCRQIVSIVVPMIFDEVQLSNQR